MASLISEGTAKNRFIFTRMMPKLIFSIDVQRSAVATNKDPDEDAWLKTLSSRAMAAGTSLTALPKELFHVNP